VWATWLVKMLGRKKVKPLTDGARDTQNSFEPFTPPPRTSFGPFHSLLALLKIHKALCLLTKDTRLSSAHYIPSLSRFSPVLPSKVPQLYSLSLSLSLSLFLSRPDSRIHFYFAHLSWTLEFPTPSQTLSMRIKLLAAFSLSKSVIVLRVDLFLGIFLLLGSFYRYSKNRNLESKKSSCRFLRLTQWASGIHPNNYSRNSLNCLPNDYTLQYLTEDFSFYSQSDAKYSILCGKTCNNLKAFLDENPFHDTIIII
jgi:hypothetical protein